MASLQCRKRARRDSYLIQFRLGKRTRTLYLGSKYGYQEAKEIKGIVERCADAITTGSTIDRRTMAWLNAMGDDLKRRFESADLIEREERLTIGELFSKYKKEEMGKMKTTTISSKASSFKVFSRLVGFAGGVSSFDKKAALEFSGLLEKTCTTATRSRTIKDVSRVFRWGMERGYLQSDPFAYVKRGSDKNKTREYFITREEYGALLDACSCQRERTLLSLYRIGGLRRGEALLTRWSDIDFAGGRFVVRSPKTENHAGHESRCVPLFPELKEELEAYWEGLAEGAPDLLFPGTSYTGTTRLVSQLVTKARLKKWPRLIQNFRSSRANEILREYGSAAESAWIGHSEATARNHYIHVLDEEYERAAGKVVEKVVEKDNKKWAQIG